MSQSVGVLSYADHGAPPLIKPYTVSTGVAVVAGNFVYGVIGTGHVGPCATNAVKCLGVATADAIAGATVHVARPMSAATMFEIKFTGTWAATLLGTYVELTVDGNGNSVADVDANSYDFFKVEELLANTATDKRLLVSIAPTANQNLIEWA